MEFEQERSPEEVSSVWPRYGLKESPYSTSPMRLVGILPIEQVFCGRVEEVKQLKKIINSSNSTRTLVVGDFGIGKTTFANYVRWLLCVKHKEKSKYLTTNTEIKMQADWDAARFLLSTLSSIYISSIVFDWEGKGIKLKSIKQLEEYVSISKQKSYQGSIAGFGGGYGESKASPPIIAPEILENLLIKVCSEIVENGKQIIIHYNNMENVKNDRLADIFRSIREYIQIEGLHTLFLGPTSTISALEVHRQVHSVFSRPLVLKPLTENDVLEILKKRCEVLKSEEGRYITPYDENTVRELYGKLNNNIRFTFKVLEDATMMYESNAPCKITMDEIKVAQEKEKKELLSALTDTHLKIITALLARPKLSQKELSNITKIGSTNLTNPVRELMKKGLVVVQQEENDKRIKYVRLSENSYLKFFFTSEKIPEDAAEESPSFP